MMSNGPAFTCTQCRHRDDSAKLYLGVPGLEAEGVCLLGGIPQCGLPGAAVYLLYVCTVLYCSSYRWLGKTLSQLAWRPRMLPTCLRARVAGQAAASDK